VLRAYASTACVRLAREVAPGMHTNVGGKHASGK
jgi:hypothetical protein